MIKARAVAAMLGAAIIAVLGMVYPASAATDGHITPGAWCGEDQHGQYGTSADGDVYICEQRGDDEIARWYPVVGAATPSSTPTTLVTPPATSQPTPAPTATAAPTMSGGTAAPSLSPATGAGGGLPVTGTAVATIAALGVMALAGGAIAVTAVRRRRTRFTA